ncbi:MAG: nitroreductase [Bacteroidota bacterium]
MSNLPTPLATNALIRSRRSVFPAQLSDKTVPDEIVKEILENATWAPTHRKTEPWRFFVFSGDSRQELAEAQGEIYKEHTPEDKFDETKYQKLLKKPLQASHIIAICMKRDAKQSVPEWEEVAAVACAVQNIYLSVTAYGLGGYWGSGGITSYEETKELFGLGETDRVLGFFYLGYPEKASPAGVRGAIEEKVTWV